MALLFIFHNKNLLIILLWSMCFITYFRMVTFWGFLELRRVRVSEFTTITITISYSYNKPIV